MAEAIKKSDIIEGKPFEEIANEITKTLDALEKYDAKIVSIAKHMKGDLSEANTKTLKGIKEVTESEIKAEKLLQEKMKTQQQSIRLSEVERKANEAKAKAEKKNTQDLDNAYKRLAKSTTELKNKSKELGATMLELEKSGRKNTDEYRKLAHQYSAVTRAAQQGDAELKKLDKTVGDNFRNVGNYESALNKLNGIFGMLGVAVGGAQVVEFLAGNEIQLQRLQLALQNVMGTTEEYNKAFSFLTNLSKDYGQDLLVLTDTYKSFIASSESSGLVLEERNKIYESIIKSGSSLALSNEQIEGALLAVSQMFSKGTVSAEELRGQLGERLPGAFGIMAKAVGVSDQELGKMMQKGEVMAADVLPKFAVELEKSFGANANKNLQTIGGSWNVLKTNLMLYVNEGNNANNVTSKIASGLRFLAENIGTIVSIGGKLLTWFIAYKTTMLAINTANKVLALGFSGIGNAMLRNIPFTKQYTLAQKEMAAASTQAGVAGQNAGRALGAIPWMIIIGLLLEVGKAIWDIASGAAQAREDLNRLNEAAEKSTKAVEKNIGQILDQQRKRNEDIQNQLTAKKITQDQYLKLLKESNQQTESELRNNKKIVNERKKLYIRDLNYIRSLQKNVKSGDASKENLKNRKILFEETKRIAEKYKIEGDESWVTFFTGEKDDIDPIDLLAQLEANINGANVKLNAYSKSIAQNSSELNKNKAEIEGNKKETTKNTKSQQEINTEFKRTNEYLSEQARLLNEIEKVRNSVFDKDRQKEIDSAIRLEVQAIEQSGEIRAEMVEEMISERYRIEREQAQNQTDFEISEIQKRYNLEKANRLQDLNDKRDELIKGAKGDKEAIAKIEANYQKELQVLESEELRREEDLNAQIRLLREKLKNQMLDITEEENKDISDANDEFIEAQIRFYDKQNEIAKDAAKERVEQQNEMMEALQKIEEGITKAIQEQIDRRINILGKQADAASKQADILKGLAESGNIQAQQSLKEQLDYQREIQREQIRLEKQKQNVEAVSAGLKVFLSEIEQGKNPASALASAFVSTNVLVNTLKGLSFFEKGTDNAPEGLAVVDEKGKELITDKNGNIKALGTDKGARMTYLNKGDKVYTATQTASLLDQINLNNRFGREITTKSNDLKVLQSGLKSIETAIQNKAETQIHWETLTMVSRTKRNGVTTTNRFVNR